MSVVKMCFFYGYALRKRRTTCGKGRRAGLKCHEERLDCPDYLPTSEYEEKRRAYIKFIGE